ncbi:MAG: dynamin family protein [Actinobacteria bacterium]|nr:dynamin family protein [Actinomycetota bacterium]
MAEFLDSFDVERGSLLQALRHFEEVWDRFLERRALEIEGQSVSDSLVTNELMLIRNDLEATSFTVGVFGLIKRGKSTLMNALVGRQVSEMHVTPETAVPVYCSYGETPEAEVHFADSSVRHVAVEDVAEYTSQKSNANNQLGVTYVHQRVPVGFLRNGTRLIDTPGLDDAHADEVYTERTMQELDICDAGVVVFLSPPNVSATEMRFLEHIVARNLKKTFLVCNMYPQHFYDVETRNAVLEYAGRKIVEATRRAGGTGEVRVYPVCALEAWNAQLEDDIDKWKRSGADRLMRELELYLTEVAGADVLADTARRIVELTKMAKSDVQVRLRLLDDPAQLAQRRVQLDGNVRELEAEYDRVVNSAMTELGPLKMRIRGMLLQPFSRAKGAVSRMQEVEELERFAGKFRREIEVAGEVASRNLADGFRTIADRVRAALEAQFHAVMSDFSPNIPEVNLGRGALLVAPEHLQELARAEDRKKQTAMAGAAGGALTGGGMAMLAIGGLLGPLGLLGGALVGWKLSGMLGGSGIERMREGMIQRLDEIADQLARDFDAQVDAGIETLRRAAARRRQMFAEDLYTQFDLVESLANDPALLDSYRLDGQRFIAAFDGCAERARQAVRVTVAA